MDQQPHPNKRDFSAAAAGLFSNAQHRSQMKREYSAAMQGALELEDRKSAQSVSDDAREARTRETRK